MFFQETYEKVISPPNGGFQFLDLPFSTLSAITETPKVDRIVQPWESGEAPPRQKDISIVLDTPVEIPVETQTTTTDMQTKIMPDNTPQTKGTGFVLAFNLWFLLIPLVLYAIYYLFFKKKKNGNRFR